MVHFGIPQLFTKKTTTHFTRTQRMGLKLSKIRLPRRRRRKKGKDLQLETSETPKVPSIDITKPDDDVKEVENQVESPIIPEPQNVSEAIVEKLNEAIANIEANSRIIVVKPKEDEDIKSTSKENDEEPNKLPSLGQRVVRVRPKAAKGERKFCDSNYVMATRIDREMRQFQNQVDQLIASDNAQPERINTLTRRPKAAKGVRTPVWAGPVNRTVVTDNGMPMYSRYSNHQLLGPRLTAKKTTQNEDGLKKWMEKQKKADELKQNREDFDFYQ